MAGQLLSPSNSRKLKTLNAVNKIKNGSPKIRDVLRERCRQRMHERRDEFLQKRRNGLSDYSEVKEVLSDIVHQEFQNVASMDWSNPSFKSDATVFNSPLEQDEALAIEEEIEEQWILQEYEKMLWEEKQISSAIADEVTCPICLKNLLQEIPNFVVCQCGLNLPVQHGLETLKRNIQREVNAHSEACLSVPKFSIFHDGDSISLCLSCMSCDFFSLA